MTIQDVEKLHYISNKTINKLLKKGLLKKAINKYKDYEEWGDGEYYLTLSKFMKKDDDEYDYNEDGLRWIYIVPEYSENPNNFYFIFLDEDEDYEILINGNFESGEKCIYLGPRNINTDDGPDEDIFYYWEFEEFWKPYLKDNNFESIEL